MEWSQAWLRAAGGGAFFRFLAQVQRFFMHKAETGLSGRRDATSALGLGPWEGEVGPLSAVSRPAIEARRSENNLPGVFAG